MEISKIITDADMVISFYMIIGVLTLNNGERYEVDWENNKQNGFGTYYYENGDIYQGEWKNDIKNGNGNIK